MTLTFVRVDFVLVEVEVKPLHEFISYPMHANTPPVLWSMISSFW
jgi:hypothetical protein